MAMRDRPSRSLGYHRSHSIASVEGYLIDRLIILSDGKLKGRYLIGKATEPAPRCQPVIIVLVQLCLFLYHTHFCRDRQLDPAKMPRARLARSRSAEHPE